MKSGKIFLTVVILLEVLLTLPASGISCSVQTSLEKTFEYSNSLNTQSDFAIGTAPQNVSHVINLHVVFVGYSESVVDTAIVNATINQYYEFPYWDAWLRYTFKTDFTFASQSYLQSLRSFIMEHSVTGTGITSALNVTALQIQKNTGKHMSIFQPQSGRAIDAGAVEQWFADKPYDPALGNGKGYTFYMLNFTELNSPDHSFEHWYNISRTDLDAKSINDYWRLEWDNALNPDVKFPYPAFTAGHRLLFVDPSAFQWYLTWARVWWRLDQYLTSPKYDYYYQDLNSFLATHNVTDPEGRSALAQYLGGWIDDFAFNLISPVVWPPTGNSVSLQILALNDAIQNQYTNEKIKWILNCTLVKESVEKLAPYMKVDVSVRFENLSSHPEIQQLLDASFLEQKNGWRYYDGYQLFYALEQTRDQYFNMKAADMTVNAYVFLIENASFESGPSGTEFTGLGGEQQVLILKSVDRYFRPDGITPKSGLSNVMIHELGHNLGFPHTFSPLQYAGDFSEDVMGYYSYFYQFCQMRTDMFRRTVVDMKLLELKKALKTDVTLGWCWPKKTLLFRSYLLNAIKRQIILALKKYDSMDYLGSYYCVVKAENLETYFREIASGTRVPGDIDRDDKCGIDDLRTLLKAYGSTPSSPRWNPAADLNKDGIVNIKDYDILKSFLGQKAKVTEAFFEWKTGIRTTTFDIGAFIYPGWYIPYVDSNVTYGLQNWGKKPASCLIRISDMTLSNLVDFANVTIYTETSVVGEITWIHNETIPTRWVKLTLEPSVRYSIRLDIQGTSEAYGEMTVITLECKQTQPCTSHARFEPNHEPQLRVSRQ